MENRSPDSVKDVVRISLSDPADLNRTLVMTYRSRAPIWILLAVLTGLSEQMGRFDEARAWHGLVVRDVPDDALSLAALARLK